MKYYYKVLEVKSTRYFSASRITTVPNCKLEYEVGKWTTPKIKGTKLYCFQTFKDARIFSTTIGWYTAIFECEAKNIGYPKRIGNIHVLTKFLKSKKNKKSTEFYSRPAPKGTISCTAIKLIERVD